MVNKWEIYYCNLDQTQGSAQRGTHPVIIISTDSVNHNISVSTVLPLSSVEPTDRIYPTEILIPQEVSGLSRQSVAMVQQIRTITHNRLKDKVGMITDEKTRTEILLALRDYFDIEG